METYIIIAIIVAFVAYNYYKLERENRNLQASIKIQDDMLTEYKMIMHVADTKNDLSRQLSNLFAYDGTSKGQVRKGEGNED